MSNANISQNDLMKLAIVSITISLCINMAVVGFARANFHNVWQEDYVPWDDNFIVMLSTQVPTTIYCIEGDETCTNELTNVPAEDTNQFDKLQSLVNVGKLMLNVFIFIGMTLIMPLYLTNVVNHYISNAWIEGIVTIFMLMWQLLIAYAIVKFIFKK